MFPASLSAPVRDRCTTGKNKLLLTIFDGFRWDYDRDVDTPNLDKMAEEGVKAAYHSTLPDNHQSNTLHPVIW